MRRQRTLWELTRGQRLRYTGAMGAMALANVFVFAVPLVSKTAIDGTVSGEIAGTAAQTLALAALAIVGLTAVGGIFHFLRVQWSAVASEAIVRGVREHLYDHLSRLPASYHDKADTGDLVQRCSSDVETVRMFLSGQVVEIGRAVLMLLTVFPILLWLDVKMALLSLATFPAIIVFAFIFFNRIKARFKEADEAEGAMTTVLQENLTGIRVVRAFARQSFERGKFGDANTLFRDRTYRLIKLLGVYWSSSDLLCIGQGGLTLIAGAWYLSSGAITVGTLYAFLTYVAIIIWPVRQMGRVLSEAGKAVVALGRMREILEVEPEPETGDPLPEFDGLLEVEGLTFGYDPEQPVLQDVSFSVKAGQTLALLGPPGSGKSTLVHLLLRLYEYDRGHIRLDGRELSGLRRSDVRAHVGAVLQEPFLYSRTLGENIRLGREQERADVVQAARDADVHKSISEFVDGYDTLVGERGVTLSGGQAQRVALARAMLQDPSLLVLDDAMSAVDTRTEAKILGALRARAGRKTTIVIAHRLSTIAHADVILVFDEGRIVQSGTHEELLGKEGPYRRLWHIQGALEEEIDEELRGSEAPDEGNETSRRNL